MTTTDRTPASTGRRRPPDRPRGSRRLRHTSLEAAVVGGFFLVMGGVHLGLASADPQIYDEFAARSYLWFVREGWDEIFMAHPRMWGLLVMAGEVTLGSLLLVGGRAARLGWAGVITFHLLLMLFGWWIWAWCVPALGLLVVLARRDGSAQRDPHPHRNG